MDGARGMSQPVSKDSLHSAISTPEEIIAEAKAGRMFILADDEDRENEGDLIIPASACDAAAVNFMARHGRGLICLAMEKAMVERLELPMMASSNGSQFRTAFTISIEAREGISTGISAADRARTIAVAIDPETRPEDIVSPGHVFPLLARDGGVLVRAGHTEAAADISRLAGLPAAGVICEIMNEDGTMARLPELVAFAQLHGLKVGTIADLIAYRRRTETIVERRLTRPFTSAHGGDFTLHIYVNKVAYVEHVALVKGDISGDAPVTVRMHALNVLEDVLGDTSEGRGGEIQAAMRMIAQEERGVIVLLREAMPTNLSARLQKNEAAPPEKGRFLRDYGVGAQILLDLGVKNMMLLTNSPHRWVVGLEGYGLRIAGHKPIFKDGPIRKD
jgi:3,4-dihydroxy 2-butanone 4-phosphate synthase/GTP cyclohydrolase II